MTGRLAREAPFHQENATAAQRARQHISEGAVTEDYKLDRKQAIAILNEALDDMADLLFAAQPPTVSGVPGSRPS